MKSNHVEMNGQKVASVEAGLVDVKTGDRLKEPLGPAPNAAGRFICASVEI